MTPEEYISTHSQNVIKAVKHSPLFASVMMAQAILESSDDQGAAGNSTLARDGKNHFGLKADASWKGEKISLKTHEVKDGVSTEVLTDFRKYTDDGASFKDRVKFLKNNKKYERSKVFTASSPAEQAKALHLADHTNDPDYTEKLIYLMTKHNLYTLDPFGNRFSMDDQILIQ